MYLLMLQCFRTMENKFFKKINWIACVKYCIKTESISFVMFFNKTMQIAYVLYFIAMKGYRYSFWQTLKLFSRYCKKTVLNIDPNTDN